MGCLDVRTASTVPCPSPTRGEWVSGRPLRHGLNIAKKYPPPQPPHQGATECPSPCLFSVFRLLFPLFTPHTIALDTALSKTPNRQTHIVYQSKQIIGFGFLWLGFVVFTHTISISLLTHHLDFPEPVTTTQSPITIVPQKCIYPPDLCIGLFFSYYHLYSSAHG